MNIEELGFIGTETKTLVNPHRGAHSKVELHEKIYPWGKSGFLLVRTQNLTSRTFNLRTLKRNRYDEISKDVCYRINPNYAGYVGRFFVHFEYVGNNSWDVKNPDGFGFGKWGNVAYHSSAKKALGELRRQLLAEDYRSYDNYITLTRYSDDLTYPETASEEFRGKLHPCAGKFFNWVCYDKLKEVL